MARKTKSSSGTETDATEDQTNDTTATEEVTAEPAEPEVETPADAMVSDEAEQAPVAATPSTMDHPETSPGGAAFLPLAFGGLIAGIIGFSAGYFLDLAPREDGRISELAGVIETQRGDIAALGDRADGVDEAIAALAPPEVDLSSIEAGIADLGAQLETVSGDLSAIGDRVTALEDRPIFTGNAGADEAAMAAAMEQIRSELQAQQDENAALAEDIRAMADEAAAAISAAEERAEASVSAATVQAALSELRIAVASGTPFAEPLAAIAEAHSLEIPEAVAAAAETGVPTLAEVEAGFPAAARAALPVALQATAGDTAGERLGAFLRSQVGGRALEPQPGDDPDAILSRSAAAVSAGDLSTALTELTALPDPAIEAMETWIELAATRLSALEALDGLTDAAGN